MKWYCDQLEKFAHHALARFTHFPDPTDRSKVEVKRVQLTLDTASHPTPGQSYAFAKDADTGVESFTPWQDPPRAPPAPAAAEPITAAPSAEGAEPATAGAADVASAAPAADAGQGAPPDG